MALKTTTEQLEEVQTAISDILTKGQSKSVGDRTLTMADLGALQNRESYLEAKLARESRSTMVIYGTVNHAQY